MPTASISTISRCTPAGRVQMQRQWPSLAGAGHHFAQHLQRPLMPPAHAGGFTAANKNELKEAADGYWCCCCHFHCNVVSARSSKEGAARAGATTNLSRLARRATDAYLTFFAVISILLILGVDVPNMPLQYVYLSL